MITKRDNQIIMFMEKYKGATINQIGKLFFPKTQFNYEYTRRRLKYLHKLKLIKFYQNYITQEYIYYLDKVPSPHDVFILNVYCELIYHGIEILEFNTNCSYEEGKIKPDGFIKFKYKEKIYAIWIEVNITHTASINRYEELYEKGEIENELGAFPAILVLSLVNREHYSDNFAIFNLDLKCNNFKEEFLDYL